MYSARERVEYADWLEELDRIGDRLDLTAETRTCATDLFLSDVPDADRSKRTMLAASIYAASLVAGDGRTQSEIADAADVSRLSIQQHWKDVLERAGLEAPSW